MVKEHGYPDLHTKRSNCNYLLWDNWTKALRELAVWNGQ